MNFQGRKAVERENRQQNRAEKWRRNRRKFEEMERNHYGDSQSIQSDCSTMSFLSGSMSLPATSNISNNTKCSTMSTSGDLSHLHKKNFATKIATAEREHRFSF